MILCNVINLKQTIFILKKLDVFCFFLYAYIVKKNHEPAAEKDVMLMKHSQKRTFMDIEKMSSNEFKAFCRQTAQTLNIPTIPAETLELYGSASRKNTKPQAQIGLGCIYDVMNRMILESDCNKVKFDEMRLA